MRDFIHIDDCIDGIFSMMKIMKPNDAVNLSTGKLTSFKEFASLASNLAGLILKFREHRASLKEFLLEEETQLYNSR